MPTTLKPKTARKIVAIPKRPQRPKNVAMNTFTAAYEQTEDGWWIGQVLEVSGALTQGRTLDEARENLQEALTLILECQRDEARRELAGRKTSEEDIAVPALTLP